MNMRPLWILTGLVLVGLGFSREAFGTEYSAVVSASVVDNAPYNLCGRIALMNADGSADGVGSGSAVGTRVVLTAAHVVSTAFGFDSQFPFFRETLSLVPAADVRWRNQYHKSDKYWDVTTEFASHPRSLTPRSIRRASGYTSRFQSIQGDHWLAHIDESVLNRDFATLTFLEDVAGGASAQLWAAFTPGAVVERKHYFMLAGYPNQTIKDMVTDPFRFRPNNWAGLMHATSPDNKLRLFISGSEPGWFDRQEDDTGAQLHLYLGDIFGWIGHSGSPLFFRDKITDPWKITGVYVNGDWVFPQTLWRAFNPSRALGSMQGEFREMDMKMMKHVREEIDASYNIDVAPNDFFLRAESVDGEATIAESFVNAAREANEPLHGRVRHSRTLWYRWDPRYTSPATITFSGGTEKSAAIYGGYDLASLYLVTQRVVNSGSLAMSFTPDRRAAYSVAVASPKIGNFTVDFGQSGPALPSISWSQNPSPIGSANAGTAVSFGLTGISEDAPIWSMELLANGLRVAGTNISESAPQSTSLMSEAWSYWGRGTVTLQGRVTDSQGRSVLSSPQIYTFTEPLVTSNALDSDSFSGRQQLQQNTEIMVWNGVGGTLIATLETNEPDHVFDGGAPSNELDGSIWWNWVAPSNGLAFVTTEGTKFSHILVVYRGTNLAALTPVHRHAFLPQYEDYPTSESSFRVRAGESYSIALQGFRRKGGSVSFSIRLLPSNIAPGALSQTVYVNKDSSASFRLPVGDPDMDRLDWSVFTAPTNGTLSTLAGEIDLSLVRAGLATNTDLVYTPNANFEGMDSLMYRVNDGQETSMFARIDFDVRVPDAPGRLETNFLMAASWSNVVTGGSDRDPMIVDLTGNVLVSDGNVLQTYDRFGHVGIGIWFYAAGETGNRNVQALAQDSSGRLAVAGQFDSILPPFGAESNGYTGLVVFENGTAGASIDLPPPPLQLDPASDVPCNWYGQGSSVSAVAFDSEDRLLIGGWFGGVNGVPCPWLARLVPNTNSPFAGALMADPSFIPAVTGPVTAITIQNDGRILALVEYPPFVLRLQYDGSRDTNFAELAFNTASSNVPSVALVMVSNGCNNAQCKAGIPGLPPQCIGSVDHSYLMGRFELNNSQYAYFLNAAAAADSNGLYDARMASDTNGGILRSGAYGSYGYSVKPGFELKPVVFIQTYDAARFCNWMHNGGATGSATEVGAYNLSQSAPYAPLRRESDAMWFLPNSDEWHKAAHFKVGTSSYWNYPTRSDSQPAAEAPPGGGNSANFLASAVSTTFVYAVGAITSGGVYSNSPGPYGTYDQGGNAMELIEPGAAVPGTSTVVRGGAWNTLPTEMHKSTWSGVPDIGSQGFRVASLASPPNPVRAISQFRDSNGVQRILIAGTFHRVNGVERRGLAMLCSSGEVDQAFSPDLQYDADVMTPSVIRALARDPNGAIYVGGSFSLSNGNKEDNVIRLLPDGSRDTSFDFQIGTATQIESLAFSGQLLVGGQHVSGVSTSALVARHFMGNQSPSVSLAGFPPDGQLSAGGLVEIIATAQDIDGHIIRVGLFVNDVMVTTATEMPYVLRWIAPPDMPASYAIHVQAVDDLGSVGLSDTYVFNARNGSPLMPAAMIQSGQMPNLVSEGPPGTFQMTVEEEGSVMIRLADWDMEGHLFAHEVFTDPINGSVEIAEGAFTYRPHLDFHGTDIVETASFNGFGDRVIQTFVIEVIPVAESPVAFDGSYTLASGGLVNFTLQAIDDDEAPLLFNIATAPTGGQLTGTAPYLTYTPGSGFSGEDHLVYQVSDGTLASGQATVRFSVIQWASAQLAAQSSPRFGGTIGGTGLFVVGTEQSLVAVPSTNWVLSSWEDGSTNAVFLTDVPLTGATIRAYFQYAGADINNDSDGDGINDWQERVAGTDESDPASYLALRVGSTGMGDMTNIAFRWISKSNLIYAIESASDPSGVWTTFTKGLGATPPLNSYTSSLGIDSRAVFRLEIE